MTDKIWWEKTVEYKFVALLLSKKKLDLALPFSGKQENAGDAIFSEKSKIILVEFKKRKSNIVSEEEKYGDKFEDAKKELSPSDEHHFLVYGEMVNDSFSLKAETYFSRNKKEIESIIDNGVGFSEFNDYLAKLLEFKKKDGRGGAGGIGPEDYTSVIGVEGGKGRSVSLKEYICSIYPKKDDTDDDWLTPTL
jgi:hypothetical protein